MASESTENTESNVAQITSETTGNERPTRDFSWKNFGVSEAVGLTGVPALAYAMAFLYEMAYCWHFDIPLHFIQLSTAQVLVVAVTLFLGLWPLFAIINLLASTIGRTKLTTHRQLQVARAIVVGLVLGAIALLVQPSFIELLFVVGVGAVIGFLDFGFPLIFQREKATYEEKLAAQDAIETSTFSIFDALTVLPVAGRFVAIGAVLLLMCSYFHGVGVASRQTKFMVAVSHPDMIVLRQYGDNFILAKFDRETKKVQREFAVLPVSSDTRLTLEKLGPFTLNDESK